MRYRHDLPARRLLVTVLLLLNAVAMREAYLHNGDPAWTNIACFLLAMLAVGRMIQKSSNAGQ